MHIPLILNKAIYSLWWADPGQQPGTHMAAHSLPPVGAGQSGKWEEKQQNSQQFN